MSDAYPTINDMPEELRGDPLVRMRAYRLAVVLQVASFPDAETLKGNSITEPAAAQLFTAVGSVAANIAEGYSKSSGKDRARIFEYALGSARESIAWYTSGKPVLGQETTTERLKWLEEIRRLLLATIPSERNRLIRKTAGKD